MRKCVVVAGVLLMSGAGPGAFAAGMVPTNMAGVWTYPKPPAGFNPLLASPEALQAYGFPPRPDASAEPAQFAAWSRLVGRSARRVLPIFATSKIRHEPYTAAVGGSGNNPYSGNWSGITDASNLTTFSPTQSIFAVFGDFVVPKSQPAFGACTPAVYSSTWVGIDGYNNSSLLAAGIDANATCSLGRVKATYNAFFETYPDNESVVANFTVTPGDDLLVELVAYSSTSVLVYLNNITSNTTMTFSLTVPSAAALVGSSCEWIVERPSVDGAAATLANYSLNFMVNLFAKLQNGTNFVGGTGTGSNPPTFVTMVDNAGSPISAVYDPGPAITAYQVEGSAQ